MLPSNNCRHVIVFVGFANSLAYQNPDITNGVNEKVSRIDIRYFRIRWTVVC